MSKAKLILGTGSPYHPLKRGGRSGYIDIPFGSVGHTHVIGKTGSGKSYWLAAFYVMLLSLGFSVTLLDPAGDLSRLVLNQLIATEFFNTYPDAFSRVVYLNIPEALRRGLYFPFNILNTPHDPHTTSDMVLEAFRRAFPASKSGSHSNIEMLIKIGSFVLAVNKLPLLPYLYYLFADAEFREAMLASVSDEVVRSAFALYGFTWSGKMPATMQPMLNRLYRIAFSPALRYSLGQTENILDFRRLLDEGRSAIINLNTPSPDVKRLLGCLYTVYAEMGARSRGEIPTAQRSGKYVLILDEFQNFAAQSGDALSSILEECRKYGLFLCLAHQHWGQAETVRTALRQCGLCLTFHLDRPDAEVSERELGFPFLEWLPKPPQVNPYSRYPLTPQYYSRGEQRDKHVDNIVDLEAREAIVRLPNRQFYRMRSLDIDERSVTERTFSYVEDTYFKEYFKSRAAIEEEMSAKLRALITQPLDGYDDATIPSREPHSDQEGLYYGKDDYNLF